MTVCATCGCSDDAGVRIAEPGRPHAHDHNHDHGHSHSHSHDHGDGHSHDHGDGHSHDHGDGHSHDHGDGHGHDHGDGGRTVVLEENVLAKNDHLAEANRSWLSERSIVAVNMMSSPGSGKTTLLERTIAGISDEIPVCVIEGDQETLLDSERIRTAGSRAVQVNTGAGCHLDADILRRGLERLSPPAHSLVFIENVGNLVCPALFDLGESMRMVIMSATEGEDKPLKYPHMFRTADLVLITKADLLPHLPFDPERCIDALQRTTPNAEVMWVSSMNGTGLDQWVRWIRTAWAR